MTSTSTGDGIPLLTRVLLIRATARFDPSFPGDAHRATAAPRSLHPGRTATSAAAPVPVHVNPSLRIAAHYAQGSSPSNESLSTNPSTLRSATTTPKEEAEFFASHAALHELLLSLAADRLDEKVRLRQVQTDIARTTVKLARASANAQGGGYGGGGGGGGRTTSSAAASAVASPDVASFFSASPTTGTGGSSPAHRSGPLGSSATSMDEVTNQSGTASTTTQQQQQQQQRVQGMLAAATATFAEDAAWRSLVTPYRPQLNPWSATPVADEGCYLSFPSPAYTHWCEQQAARCCAGSSLDANSTEPDSQCGPMRYNDVVHYASVNGVGKSAAGSGGGASRGGRNAGNTSSCPVEDEVGYLHGYVLLLDGAVFAGAGDQKDGSAADDGHFSEDDGEVSVLLWCVLSDAPVFNFMRALALEVAAGMSYVAQRTYHTTASTHTNTRTGAGVSTDVYASLLDATLDEEVVRPLAAELTTYGSGASRTLPGDTFTVNMRIRRSNQTGVAARPQTSSLSSSLTFRRPLDLLFPSADVPFSVLLMSFGEDALRVLQSLLLQEERVVVVGATPQHASACVVSLVSLIAPFTWVSPLVPYLPPHTAAQTGFLHTLLSSPYELQQQQSQQSQPPYASPVSPRPAPYSAGVASQSSQQLESGGFLVGSTAAIRPYLMFLSAFGVAEDMGGKGRSGRTPRVWLADARTGAVGVCPTEPISLYLRIDPAATAAGDVDSDSAPAADGSCGALGGASPWTQAAHLDLRLAAPQMYAPRPTTNSSLTNGSMSSSTGGGASGSRGSRTAHNPYVLYNTVRNTLRTAAELNVMDATPLDVLPPFHDELRDALRKAAPAEKRRQFRQALEEQTQHAQVRLDNLASLAARLVRGLREALRASALASGATRQTSFSVNSEDEDDSGGSSSSYSSGSSSDSDGDDDDDDEANESGVLRMDDNASFRAVTAAVAQSQSVSFADPTSSNLLAQFPVLSAAEVWQVQTTFFAYVVGRLAGGYRRGITLVGGASHRGTGAGKRRYMEASVFLAPGLEQHYTLAETVARTHLFRQFECAVLAMETIGLRQVLSGCGLRVGRGVHETGERAGEAHAVLKYVRPLVQLALLCDRARLQFPELYCDHPDLDAVRSVYAAVVKRCFSNAPGTQRVATLPPIIGVLAGYNGNNMGSNAGGGGGGGGGGNSRSSPTSADPNRASALSSGSSGGTYSTRSGGGFRGFLSKAMKAMKINSGGSSGSGSGSGAGSGGGRGLPVLYLPASVACMNSFSVVPFSEQHVAPQSFDITTYDAVGPDGKRRHHRHQSRGGKKKKEGKGNRRRHRRQRIAEMYAIPVKPQRQQWARQQQHQQLTAMNIDFTLDDCTSVVRNHHVVGGVSGSLTSSFAASSLAAGAGVSNGSIYVSGGGLDAEVLGALARAGGSRRSGSHDATLRVMAETSLSVCHALPLDVVHQFDAYEPLLAPVLSAAVIAGSFASSTNTNTTSGPLTVLGNGSLKAATADEDVASPAAYMAVGLLCPSCVNVWREGEARATRVLLEQRQQRQQQQLQQSSRRRMSASPPFHAHTNSSLLPPKPPRLMGASTPLEAQSWSTPAASLSAHQQQQQQQQLLNASSAASGLPPPSSWCTFSSGAPLGYPIDGTPRSYTVNNATLASSAEFSTTLASNAAPLLSAAASPTPQMPQTLPRRHHQQQQQQQQQQPHHDEWDSWGVRAPVVVNSPNTATVPTRGTATNATTTATSIESTSSRSSAAGSPSGMMPLTLGSAALPLAAPAPGDVMDELFAGLSSYKANSGTSASVSSVTAAGSPQGKPRQQTLDDFF